MDWIIEENSGRVEKESCAPYHANDRSCNDDDNCNYSDSRVTGFYNKWYTTEAEMKELVYIAPVATTVYVSCQVLVVIKVVHLKSGPRSC